ncbi:MAG: Pr6Pr family membrane protein [Pleurocapsa minor GSE-CHR-MK-17-07R]|jgi:hypothetical protein|nr:Pr6Pr family membrane protein [Pleurocapsa minor GSE-CHR-MK 17-07R]
MNNNRIAGIFRLGVALLCLYGVAQPMLSGGGSTLHFFTVQSNIILMIVLGWAGIASLRGSAPPPHWLKGAATLYILITGIVYNLLLRGPDTPAPFAQGLTNNDIVHILTPLLGFIDFLIFDSHRRFKWTIAIIWLAYPIAYVVFTTVRGALFPEQGYPYFFVNVNELGYGGLITSVIQFAIGFFILGLILYGIDRLLPKRLPTTAG